MGVLGQVISTDEILAIDWQRHLREPTEQPGLRSRPYAHLLGIADVLDAEGKASEATVVRLVAATISMRLQAGTANNLFHPLLRSGDDVSTCIEDYDSADVACLQILTETAADPWLKARFADVTCIAGQRLGLKMWRYGKIAASAYLEHCEEVMCGENGVASREEMQRGLELACMFCKSDRELHDRYWNLIEAAIRHALAQGWPGVFLPLSELVRGRNRELAHQLAPVFEQHAAQIAAPGDSYHPENAQTCLEIAARYWERNRDDASARRCQQAAAELLIERAKMPSQAMLKADWMAEGIAKLRQYGGDRNRIRELLTELADVRRTIMEEMQLHEFPLDVRPLIEHVRATVVGPTEQEGLMQLAYGIGHGPRFDSVHQSVLDNHEQHPIVDMFAQIHYNSEGVPVARRDAFDPSNEEHAYQKMVEQARDIDFMVATPSIFEAIDVFNEKFEPSLNTFVLYAHRSPGIPDGHEDSIARGLMAGFNHDWLEVAAFLIPQVEAIVRNIYKRHGNSTLADRGDGTEEEMSLNQLLEGGDANEVLGKDFVFQLRALLTEKSGYNLRNLYTHGLLSDDSLHTHGLFNLWWILLRMILFVPWGYDWMQARVRQRQNSRYEGHPALEA
jgi:hypothetical protein